MWENPHQETGVAWSRNSPPSPPGRPSPSLLYRAFSEPTRVATSCINLSLFLPWLQLPPSCLPVPAPALLAILGPALVGIYASAALGYPGRNFLPLFSAGFLRFSSVEISTPIRLFNRRSYPFSLFGNLILAQADASFQLVSALLIHRLQGNYMWKCAHILPALCKSSSLSRLGMK
jgi:hypothetical protein